MIDPEEPRPGRPPRHGRRRARRTDRCLRGSPDPTWLRRFDDQGMHGLSGAPSRGPARLLGHRHLRARRACARAAAPLPVRRQSRLGPALGQVRQSSPTLRALPRQARPGDGNPARGAGGRSFRRPVRWLRRHRGLSERTIARHLRMVSRLLPALGADPHAYDAARVRAVILGERALLRGLRQDDGDGAQGYLALPGRAGRVPPWSRSRGAADAGLEVIGAAALPAAT